MTGRVRMRTVYLRPGLSRGLPARCSVLSVSPLLRELVLEAANDEPSRTSEISEIRCYRSPVAGDFRRNGRL